MTSLLPTPRMYLWNIIQFVLTVGGWFAAFQFGIRQQRINTKEGAKLKVYEEIWKQRSALQNSTSALLTQIQAGPPFILLESTKIFGNVTKDPQHIQQGQQDALSYLNTYLINLQTAQSAFSNQLLEFWRSLEMWLYVMPDLEVAIRTLMSEYSTTQEKTHKLVVYLTTLDRWQWGSWDRKVIKEICDEEWKNLYNLSAYVEDLMSLVHNELISPMFVYAKDFRQPTDPRYKVLTKGGLSVIKK